MRGSYSLEEPYLQKGIYKVQSRQDMVIGMSKSEWKSQERFLRRTDN